MDHGSTESCNLHLINERDDLGFCQCEFSLGSGSDGKCQGANLANVNDADSDR